MAEKYFKINLESQDSDVIPPTVVIGQMNGIYKILASEEKDAISKQISLIKRDGPFVVGFTTYPVKDAEYQLKHSRLYSPKQGEYLVLLNDTAIAISRKIKDIAQITQDEFDKLNPQNIGSKVLMDHLYETKYQNPQGELDMKVLRTEFKDMSNGPIYEKSEIEKQAKQKGWKIV